MAMLNTDIEDEVAGGSISATAAQQSPIGQHQSLSTPRYGYNSGGYWASTNGSVSLYPDPAPPISVTLARDTKNGVYTWLRTSWGWVAERAGEGEWSIFNGCLWRGDLRRPVSGDGVYVESTTIEQFGDVMEAVIFSQNGGSDA